LEPEAEAERRQDYPDAPDAVQLWWLRDWMEADSDPVEPPSGVEVAPGGNPVPAAFEALDVTEVADYRVYPEGAEDSPGFYRLTADGTLVEIDWPSP
jgi:hypothetical protein